MQPARVRLRPVRRDDLDHLEAARNDPEWAGFNWFGHKPPEELRRRFEQTGLLDDGDGLLVVELADGTLVGDVGWHGVHYGPPATSTALNIGIAIAPGQRGQGYGTEAQRLLADYLFATTRAERVEASTDVENLAEQRALEKAGFTREGVLRRAQFREGAFHDLVVFSRLRGE
jgi:RimJ/RimL family protein N-acetyltransferase